MTDIKNKSLEKFLNNKQETHQEMR